MSWDVTAVLAAIITVALLVSIYVLLISERDAS
jgi:hypothetical protein